MGIPKRKASLSNRLLLNPEVFPKFRFVKTDNYFLDYNIHTDMVSINTQYESDKTYLSVLGLMESSINPSRGVRLFHSARLFDRTIGSRSQSNMYFSERITCNIATLIMLVYLGKYKNDRLKHIYNLISDACNQCKLANNAPPLINMLEVYKICQHYIHQDDEGKNKAKLGRIYNTVTRKLQRDFSQLWLTDEM